jgi:hypothetical protein
MYATYGTFRCSNKFEKLAWLQVLAQNNTTYYMHYTIMYVEETRQLDKRVM